LIAIIVVSFGCQPPPSPPKDAPPAPLAARFNPKETGSIRGRVVWSGRDPNIEPIKLPFPSPDFGGEQPNPNAPTIDPPSQGMADVLVFLRAVSLDHSRPWPHDPATVAFEKGRLEIRQGPRKSRLGIVRRGEEIACVAYEKRNHILEARGASVFSLPLLLPETITRRKLTRTGILELSSGSALYWLRGYLWISEHPYAAITNATGEFELTEVLADKYEVVCWAPNWHIKRRERHPEFGEIERLIFAPAAEQSAQVTVAAGEAATATFRFNEMHFMPPE
jgi:hypothetical protein